MKEFDDLVRAVADVQLAARRLGLDPVRIQLHDILDARAMQTLVAHEQGPMAEMAPNDPNRLPPNQLRIGDTIFFWRPDPNL